MTKRVASIESFRVLAIFAVILCHTGFATDLSRLADENLPVVLTGYLVWWVGVPYFCITAGYFFRQSIVTDGNPIGQLRRYVTPFAWMFLGWMCIYIVMSPSWAAEVFHRGLWQPLYSETLKNMHLLATKNISLFLEGGRPIWHLWFLPALMFSLAMLTLITICRLEKYVVPLIISLYVLALTEELDGGHFLNSSLHVGTWSIALLFTAIGGLFVEREQHSTTVAWSLIIAGYAAALMEGEVMTTIFHMTLPTLRWHFFLGGIILAVGIFQLALAKPKFGQSTPFPFLAQFTLGVYVSHILVLYTLSPIIWRVHLPLRGALVGIVVYVFSVLLTIVLGRVRLVRYLVVRPVPSFCRQGASSVGRTPAVCNSEKASRLS